MSSATVPAGGEAPGDHAAEILGEAHHYRQSPARPCIRGTAAIVADTADDVGSFGTHLDADGARPVLQTMADAVVDELRDDQSDAPAALCSKDGAVSDKGQAYATLLQGRRRDGPAKTLEIVGEIEALARSRRLERPMCFSEAVQSGDRAIQYVASLTRSGVSAPLCVFRQ